MAHGHDILHMMEGNNYQNKEDLVNAIIEKFGPNERFLVRSMDSPQKRWLISSKHAENSSHHQQVGSQLT